MFAFLSAGGSSKLGRRLLRPFGAWLGFTGLYALAGGACPCCGLPSCPVGLVGAGIVGALMTTGLHLWRRFSGSPDARAAPHTQTMHDTQTMHEHITHEETAQ